jgi:hypothetical protein
VRWFNSGKFLQALVTMPGIISELSNVTETCFGPNEYLMLLYVGSLQFEPTSWMSRLLLYPLNHNQNYN